MPNRATCKSGSLEVKIEPKKETACMCIYISAEAQSAAMLAY